MEKHCRSNKLSATYRRTSLMVCSAVRTISDDAVSGIMSIDILADGMTNIHNAKTKSVNR